MQARKFEDQVKDQTIPYSNVLRRNLVFWIFLIEKCGSGLLGWRCETANQALQWDDRMMQQGTWDREDYQELLEPVVIYLGGVVKRIRKNSAVPIDVHIRKPGAVHHARFMAPSLYIKDFNVSPPR